jgi:putative ABC transport system ATP-binding protein
MFEAPHSAILQTQALEKRVATASGPLTILRDVNLTVERGESLAILGASGSGKSTLLSLLAGLDLPSSGQVYIDGCDLFALDEDGRAALRARSVGFVFQSFQLLPAFNALENVMLPLELKGVPQAALRAERILRRVGLGERLRHTPRTLSGGEQQRVAIARAFATEPQLLFADEPTGNLDSVTGAQVIELLFELNRERGATLILVTHDSNIAGRCHRRMQLVAGSPDTNDEYAGPKKQTTVG